LFKLEQESWLKVNYSTSETSMFLHYSKIMFKSGIANNFESKNAGLLSYCSIFWKKKILSRVFISPGDLVM